VAPVQNIDDFMNYEQVIANGMVQTVKEPKKGNVKEMGIPVDVTGCPGKIKGPSPQPGQHTREVLKELGYSAQDVKRLKQEQAIKVAPRRK
jgi:crotonobetainyl-CoA:carnitine CoA-transferase CaiB-like acyl-CoA transferase